MMAIPLVLVLVATAVVAVVLAQVRIGSDRYQEIIQAKDLVADVLPPPEYIVETHLTVNQLAVGAGDERAAVERIERLEQEFQTRHDVWVGSLSDPATRQAMLVDAYEPAQEYFDVLNAEFLPAWLRGTRS
jgi:methyl-accepting chemotaxis protein